MAVSFARELEVAEAAEESIRRKALRDLDERDRRHALALAEKRNQEYDPVAAAWAAVDANELAAQAAAELEVVSKLYFVNGSFFARSPLL